MKLGDIILLTLLTLKVYKIYFQISTFFYDLFKDDTWWVTFIPRLASSVLLWFVLTGIGL